MKVRVDGQLCQGHTLCAMTAPDVFTLREEDGHAVVVEENVSPDAEATVRDAARSCPEQAVVLVDIARLPAGSRGGNTYDH